MDPESGTAARPAGCLNGYKMAFLLAYQSFGVVYGDLSISPIYVFKSTFSGKLRLHENDDEVFGVLSLVFWTLTLIALVKYIIIVLEANDHGEGGTFALYSLMCRHSSVGLLNIPHIAHEHLSPFQLEMPANKETKTSLLIRSFFEKHQTSRIVLLLMVLSGTGMVIGDGVLTPSMSVLSAVSGVKVKAPNLHENYTVFIACVVLIALFALQHYGTRHVGFLFAPVMIGWLLCICGIGIYNVFKWNPAVIRALSPYYIYNFFRKSGKDGWSSLGGVVLCITGAEAMFADLGHFSKLSLRMAFTGVVYPCLVLAYMGEAAYLSKNKADLQRSFYKAIPETIFWPVFVIATLATVVGSQAIISATFSIISQCRALKCFPRIKVVHTSTEIYGQIYIPEVNWILMLMCLAVTIGFRDTDMIGNAYGLTVISVMLVTTCLMFLIITTVWKKTVIVAFVFTLFFGSLELLYFTACLEKVPHGGWLPVLFSLIIVLIMGSWHYGTSKKETFELQNKICLDRLLKLGPSLGLVRIPGVGLIYSNVVTGVPPMFAHFVTNFPAFHRILIFVSVQSLTIPKVPGPERFLIGRIGPPEYRMFRCIVRYGYKDERRDSYDFETQLIMKVAEFLQREGSRCISQGGMSVIGNPSSPVMDAMAQRNGTARVKKVRFVGVNVNDEVKELAEAREAGVAYMMGHTYVVAQDGSSFIEKVVVNILYGFLRQNCRHPAISLGIPHSNLIEVGTVYQV